MDKADEYRLRAAECLALALRMPSAQEREQLRNMASIWDELAVSAQPSSHHHDDFQSWEPQPNRGFPSADDEQRFNPRSIGGQFAKGQAPVQRQYRIGEQERRLPGASWRGSRKMFG